MDEQVKEDEIFDKDFSVVYVYGNDGKPAIFDQDGTCRCYIRYTGYTCGNIFLNRETKKVEKIILTRRGGGFYPDRETVFKDPDALEALLNKKFVGKELHFYEGNYDQRTYKIFQPYAEKREL